MSTRGRPRQERETRECERDECQESFEVLPSSTRRFCSRSCGNKSTAGARAESNRSLGRYTPPVCPCGKTVEPPPGLRYVYEGSKKYCSPECRAKYGKKRQRDPSKWVIRTCETCGEDFEFRVNSKNQGRFCSNACAAKHTKVVRHYVVREADMVLDSTWEMLFAGLCGFGKVPCERADRSQAIEWDAGHWYCPDFYLPTLDTYVEVKGLEDDEDAERWDAWRLVYQRRLLVLDWYALDQMRSAGSIEQWLRGGS